jgi:parvulin-like peptidyl-prolyl isomerase
MALLVNGEIVEDAILREEECAIRPRLEEAMAGEDPGTITVRVRDWARENVIERIVLRQAALADPEPVPAGELEKMMSDVRTQSPNQSGCLAPVDDDVLRKELDIRFRVERLMSRVTANLAPPKSKDISGYYVRNRASFVAPEQIHASHIVKNVDEHTTEADALAAIREIEQLLAANGDFAQLADQHSDCPGRGGDLGFFPRGQMVDEFDKVVFALDPGQVSGIFRSPFGFHIAKVHDLRPEGVRSLQEVRQQIAETLLEEKRRRAIEQFLDRLIAKVKVEQSRP